MQLAEIQTNKQVSMTSLQIAELVNSRHDKVKQSIERLAASTDKKKAVIALPPMGIVVNTANNRTYETEVYIFSGEQGKRDTYIVVAQLSPEFTAALVDRWQELESSQSLALPNFTDPAAAAEAWAKEYREKQALAITLEQAKPKINHYDKVVERKNLVNATQVGAKLNGMSAIVLNRHLTELGVYNRNVKRGKVFSTWFEQKGYGEMKQSESGFDQPLFTQKGQAWVIETLTSEGMV